MATLQFTPPSARHRRESRTILTPARCTAERQALFNRIAPVYDNLNDLLSLGSHRVWKRMSVSWSGAKEGDTVLDVFVEVGIWLFFCLRKLESVASITLVIPSSLVAVPWKRLQLSSCQMKRTSVAKIALFAEFSSFRALILKHDMLVLTEVIALDFSKEQLQIAASRQRERSRACYKNIEKKALEEMCRVLKPGTKLSVLDFNKSTNPLTSSIQDWMIDNVVVPVASGYGLASEYQYLKNSIKEYLTGWELEKLALQAGFSEAKHYEIGTGFMGNLDPFQTKALHSSVAYFIGVMAIACLDLPPVSYPALYYNFTPLVIFCPKIHSRNFVFESKLLKFIHAIKTLQILLALTSPGVENTLKTLATEAAFPCSRPDEKFSLVSLSSMVFSSVKGGLVGAGRFSFFTNIFSALDIDGRNKGISWVHNNPT
ncbi:2-phytyl-1,4-beta-naphthoquinone methyltransferase, chloroplastic [Sesamum angolense]|uniref:2-phytyl-1,4-beta-naphthoquinone methyltransferase, chloroplastic n=1 Tax=Sesamum angolense TaxID=2727404 RepID=A0AAE2BVU9_9LAMI|nr:2-phytyl-1,4-beta-naphthoquinone methyltransferase, chloroplastic [Sesamum angolense]